MILLLSRLLVLSRPASGFDRIAHEAIGHIAESRLNSGTLQRIREIVGPGQSLASISYWADEVRKRRPETGPWHYINLPVRHPLDGYLSIYCPNNDCVIAQIQINAAAVSDPSKDRRERDEALKFLVHFMGDIHQPLHCGDDGDRGGNEKLIRFQGQSMNLHALWDRLITKENTGDPVALAKRLAAGINAAKAGRWSEGNPTIWCLESWRVAKEIIYKDLPPGPQDLSEMNLGEAYFRQMRPVAEEQLQRRV